MNKLSIAIPIAVLAMAGTAFAAHHEGPSRFGGGMDPFGDKTVTRAEMQAHAAQLFDKLDANKDGKLDPADRAAHHAAMFDKLDADKDGKIARDEFTSAHGKGPEGAPEGGPDAGKGMRGGHGRMGMMMLHMADTNGDKAVSRDEFTAAAAAHFDKADANKDGSLTPAERKAAHQALQKTMGRKSMHGMTGEHGNHGSK